MITLSEDCLLFELQSGESIPYSADMLTVEIMGDTSEWFDSDFVKQAAKAIFHYFRHDLGRQSITVAEFSEVLEKVLQGFRERSEQASAPSVTPGVKESDLHRLARESADGCELFFFPLLRDELRQQLRTNPRMVRFRGLRDCVKELAGTQRWTVRCQSLEEQVVGFLRECLTAEARREEFAMVVE